MKSLKISFLGLLLVLTTIVSAKNYDVRTLKPYFSIGGEFRNMKSSELNAAIFDNYTHYTETQITNKDGDVVDTLWGTHFGQSLRNVFPTIGTKNPILGVDLGIIDLGSTSRIELFSMGLEAGILWEGVQIGFSFQLTEKLQSTPTALSVNGNRPRVVFSAPNADGEVTASTVYEDYAIRIWTASSTISDYIFVMGYELFPEASFFQLVPRIGLGFSSINIQPPGAFNVYFNDEDERLNPFYLQKQDYSALGKSFQFELESRLNFFSRFSLSAGIGYRFTSFDEVKIAAKTDQYFIRGIVQDADADHLYISAKATVFFPSLYEQETGKPIRRK